VASEPWEGYCPDTSPIISKLNQFAAITGLVPFHGQLTVDAGFIRFEDSAAVDMPFGGEEAAAGVNTPLLPATAGTDYVMPVVGVAEYVRQDQTPDRFWVCAMTGLSTTTIDNGAPFTPPDTSEVGFLHARDPNTSQWANVPFGGVGTEAAPVRENLYDFAFYRFGGTGISGSTTPPGLMFMCNIDKQDEVYTWDLGAGGGPPGQYDRYSQFIGADFFAASCEVAFGRVVFLNTKEGTSDFPYRMRFTDVNAVVPSLTLQGSGFIDWSDFAGEGLRVLSIADRLACYFEDGVGIAHRTFDSLTPFLPQYIVKTRGLIAPMAVCKVSEDMHFGIFTDGWYLMDADGGFNQLGLNEFNSEKWKDTFYTLLRYESRRKTTVSYDFYYHRVRIAFPVEDATEDDGDHMEVWVYDLATDSVWPDNRYEATCWAHTDFPIDLGLTWAQSASIGTWADAAGRWLDYQSSFGDRVPIHGDKYGRVMVHDKSLTQYDGEDRPWDLTTKKVEIGDPIEMTMVDEVRMSHLALIVDLNVSMGVKGEGVAVSETETFNMKTEDPNLAGEQITAYTNPRVSNNRLGITAAASKGPVAITSLQLAVHSMPGKDIK
jgi:hypothetical protein